MTALTSLRGNARNERLVLVTNVNIAWRSRGALLGAHPVGEGDRRA